VIPQSRRRWFAINRTGRAGRATLISLAILFLVGLMPTPSLATRHLKATGDPGPIRRSQLPHHDTAIPPDTLADGRTRLLWIDFGIPGQGKNEAWSIDGSAPSSVLAWMGGMVRLIRRENSLDRPGAGDLYEGSDATFAISIDSPGPCRLRLTLGDEKMALGPFNVVLPDFDVASNIRLGAGEFRDLEFEATPVAGRLSIRLSGVDCGSFGIVGLTVHAPVGSRLTSLLFDPAPISQRPGASSAIEVPSRSDSLAVARRLLREACDYLLASRPNEGCFSMAGSWYQSAYAIRTLLAGARLFNDPVLSEAAYECLDRFVDEQRPEGSWSATYFGRAGCPSAAREVAAAPSANLADVGSAALALAVGSTYADEPRRARYLAACRLFADAIVLPNQLENGAFVNLKFMGVDHRFPYSVATGVQASNLSALYAATGDVRYLEAAERAARFLLTGFVAGGRYAFHHHDRAAPENLQMKRFGDLFYVMEGLTWVKHYTADTQLAAALDGALERFLWGQGGVSGSRTNAVLWMASNPWEASKQGALMALLANHHSTQADSAALQQSSRNRRDSGIWIHDFVDWLDRPVNAARLGFMVDVASPGGVFAFPATGFAGIGLAAVIDPEILYPPR